MINICISKTQAQDLSNNIALSYRESGVQHKQSKLRNTLAKVLAGNNWSSLMSSWKNEDAEPLSVNESLKVLTIEDDSLSLLPSSDCVEELLSENVVKEEDLKKFIKEYPSASEIQIKIQPNFERMDKAMGLKGTFFCYLVIHVGNKKLMSQVFFENNMELYGDCRCEHFRDPSYEGGHAFPAADFIIENIIGYRTLVKLLLKLDEKFKSYVPFTKVNSIEKYENDQDIGKIHGDENGVFYGYQINLDTRKDKGVQLIYPRDLFVNNNPIPVARMIDGEGYEILSGDFVDCPELFELLEVELNLKCLFESINEKYGEDYYTKVVAFSFENISHDKHHVKMKLEVMGAESHSNITTFTIKSMLTNGEVFLDANKSDGRKYNKLKVLKPGTNDYKNVVKSTSKSVIENGPNGTLQNHSVLEVKCKATGAKVMYTGDKRALCMKEPGIFSHFDFFDNAFLQNIVNEVESSFEKFMNEVA